MGNRFKLTEDQIKEILRKIDNREYTQSQLAEIYGVSQGTISNYNRNRRMKFRIEDDSRLITKLRKEISKITKMDINKNDIPKSFTRINNLKYKVNDETGKYVDEIKTAYFVESRYDAVKFIEAFPEYHLYTIIGNKDNKTKWEWIRSDARVNVSGYLVTKKNLGKILSRNKIKILNL